MSTAHFTSPRVLGRLLGIGRWFWPRRESRVTTVRGLTKARAEELLDQFEALGYQSLAIEIETDHSFSVRALRPER